MRDWAPATGIPKIREKVITINLCDWWPGQPVRVPVALFAPSSRGLCRDLLVSGMGLDARPSLPGGAMLRLLKQDGVGVVLVGIGPIDQMQPVEILRRGMKRQLLRTKDARFTPLWIWAVSYMRALTAAVAESGVFRPIKVLATGGSKRGMATAAAGIYDSRFTAIMPVVTPILGDPDGPYVINSDSDRTNRIDSDFLANLAAHRLAGPRSTARQALMDQRADLLKERISMREAQEAGWTAADIATINRRAWEPLRVTAHWEALSRRGFELLYNDGSNDNVTPGLLELGRRFPHFPIYIVPGGQHGGPKGAAFTRRVPLLATVDDNLYAFAQHHFFGARPLVSAPNMRYQWENARRMLKVTVRFSDGSDPQENRLWWSVNRHPPGTIPFEYDTWESAPLRRTAPAVFAGEVAFAADPRTLDIVTTHTQTLNGLTLSVSSPLEQINFDKIGHPR